MGLSLLRNRTLQSRRPSIHQAALRPAQSTRHLNRPEHTVRLCPIGSPQPLPHPQPARYTPIQLPSRASRRASVQPAPPDPLHLPLGGATGRSPTLPPAQQRAPRYIRALLLCLPAGRNRRRPLSATCLPRDPDRRRTALPDQTRHCRTSLYGRINAEHEVRGQDGQASAADSSATLAFPPLPAAAGTIAREGERLPVDGRNGNLVR